MFDKLSAPFPENAIHWRAQVLTKNKDKALALAYLDARDVMDRLDSVVGPDGWQDRYEETPQGRVFGTISICTEGGWVSKSDGSGDTAVEAEKGGISGAFKRTAVKWGIGRYLYRVQPVWAPCEVYNGKWSAWKPEAAVLFKRALEQASNAQPYSAAEKPTPPPTITEEQRTELMLFMDGLKFPVERLLTASKIEDLRELPAEKFEPAKKWITKQTSQMENA